MILQAMYDASRQPERAALHAHLGKATPFWDAVISLTRERSPQLVEVWQFAGPKYGWSLRLVEKGRILMYLTPEEGAFRVGLALGARAVAAAREAGLSKAAATILDAAPRYAEGHGVRLQIASRKDIAPVPELLAIKLFVPPKASRRTK